MKAAEKLRDGAGQLRCGHPFTFGTAGALRGAPALGNGRAGERGRNSASQRPHASRARENAAIGSRKAGPYDFKSVRPKADNLRITCLLRASSVGHVGW